MADQIIGEILLGGSTKLIFSMSEWRGRSFANVRKFVATQKYSGATKSGLVMEKKLLRELTGALSELENSLPSQIEQEIKRIVKNRTDYIKITTLPAEDGEKLPAVDVREFVDAPTYQGPTKRGIRFRWNLLPDVLACFRKQLVIIGEEERNEPSLFGTSFFADPYEEPQKTYRSTPSNGIVELLGEAVKLFPDAFLDGAPSGGNRMKIPEDTLLLDQDNAGNYCLKTNGYVFCTVRNPAEGNFIIYSQMRGHRNIVIPSTMINVFKSVKAYENYVRSVQNKLITKVLKRVGQRSVADYEARKKMAEAGLPWLVSE
jgi:hypothetical protein